jgi:hypothetical protein
VAVAVAIAAGSGIVQLVALDREAHQEPAAGCNIGVVRSLTCCG